MAISPNKKTQDQQDQEVLHTFLEAFGNPEKVRAELHDYWMQHAGSPFPQLVFKHLLNEHTRAKGQRASNEKFLTPNRAKLLGEYFDHSFEPEQTTNYIEKHREPLVRAMVAEYVKEFPRKSLYRIDADIMNLGGLNRDIEAAGGSRGLADAVIRKMTSILKDHVAALGEVCAIRHGGDELSLYLLPRKEVSKKDVKEALAAAHKETAEFILAAGLRDVKHTKENAPPGVGIGYGRITLFPERSAVEQVATLGVKIEDSKKIFQKLLGSLSNEPKPVDIGRIEGMFTGAESVYRFGNVGEPRIFGNDKDYSGADPAQSRHQRLVRHYSSIGRGRLNDAEHTMLHSLAALSAKDDFVTGLPLYAHANRQVLPNFRTNYGDKAKVIHFDFNNVGGGNKVSSWLGDEMLRVFAGCIKESMEKNGLKKYEPYLMTQGGGKFTLLVPPETSVRGLQADLDISLFENAKRPLEFNQEEFDVVRQALRTQNIQQLKGRKEPLNLSKRQLLINANSICINDVDNVKARSTGSRVVCVSEDVADVTALITGPEMKRLEGRTKAGQEAIGNYEERNFEWKHQQRLKREKGVEVTFADPDKKSPNLKRQEGWVGKIKLSRVPEQIRR